MRSALFEFDGRMKEDGGQQFLSGRGVYNDGYTNVRRLESHGFYSSPPPKSQGLLIYPNGHPDEAYLLGVDHRDHRPSGLGLGATAIYDANGQIIKMVSSGLVVDTASKTVTITSGAWTVTAPMITFNGNFQVNGNVTVSGTVVDGDGNNGA
jgi:phage baseplate assembly protein V